MLVNGDFHLLILVESVISHFEALWVLKKKSAKLLELGRKKIYEQR